MTQGPLAGAGYDIDIFAVTDAGEAREMGLHRVQG